MALKITKREEDGVAIAALEGRLAQGEGAVALREELRSMLEAGQRRIVLDMWRVSQMDGAGLATLIAGGQAARSHGATLKLFGLRSHFQALLRVAGSISLFELYDSESSAVGSFQS